MVTGILLFAHGSRDPNWKRPFESLLSETQRLASGPVALAFLESMQPDFDHGIQALLDQGVRHIRVVPIFLAAGSHLRQDLPQMITAVQAAHPGITIEVTPAIGEVPQIQAAIAAFATTI